MLRCRITTISLSLLALVGFLFPPLVADAATITYVGVDEETNDAWRTTGVAKSLDPDGDNVYGTDGYFAAIKVGGGVDASPDYVTVTIVAALGDPNAELDENYQASFDDPDLTGPADVSDIVCGDWWLETADTQGAEIDFFRIELTEDASFRLGVLADQTGAEDPFDVLYEGPSGVRVRASDGPADSGMIDTLGTGDAWRNGDLDYFFFDVSGQAGDTFIVSGLDDDRWEWLAMAGVTFDVPEPSSLFLAAMGVLGLALVYWRRRH